VQKINFKELISSYDQNLLDNLRGFGKDDEYLKFWVPGTDNYQSFLNLIDALIESKIFQFQISFQEVSREDDFIKKIEEILIDISNFNKINDDYEINLNNKKYLDFKIRHKKKFDKEVKLKIDQTKIAIIEKNEENIEKIYRENLSHFLPNDYYINKIQFDKNIFKESFKEIDLFFEIENDIIINVFHNSNKSSDREKLINIFFDLIINKDIQEAADHGVIYLEEKIRIFNNAKISPGIILPRQAGEYFNVLNNIIRDVFNNYKIKNNLKFDVNKNYFIMSEQWKLFSNKEKLQKINTVLDKIKSTNISLENDSISVNKIENNFKIYLDVDKNFSKLQREKNIILDIEIKLKTLDNTLEVFVEEILDQNKLRLKNSPQKI
jgi:hypothetical protein